MRLWSLVRKVELKKTSDDRRWRSDLKEEDLLKLRVKNWYFKKHTDIYFLCGDRLYNFDNDKPVYRFYELGFLRFEKVVKSGFQARVLDKTGEFIVNCRWDMADRYFKYKANIVDKIMQSYPTENGFNPNHIIPYLQEVNICAFYDDPINREEFVDVS